MGIKYAAAACLSCANCLQGGETACTSDTGCKVSGFMYPGTFQQYVVSAANYVTPVPDSLTDLAAAAPLMCGGLTVYAALKRAAVKQGDWVVVSGAGGGLGHLAVQYAKVMGARVLGVDAGGKEKLARDLGAEEFLDFTAFENDEALAARVKEVTGGGAQIVLVCAATARAYASGIMWLGFRGKLCCLGLPEPESEPALAANVISMVLMELTITGKHRHPYKQPRGWKNTKSPLKTAANKGGNRLDAIEAAEIAARYGFKTQYQLRKMNELTEVGRLCLGLIDYPCNIVNSGTGIRGDGSWEDHRQGGPRSEVKYYGGVEGRSRRFV